MALSLTPTANKFLAVLSPYPMGLGRTSAAALMAVRPTVVTRAGKALWKAGLARQNCDGIWKLTDAGRAEAANH